MLGNQLNPDAQEVMTTISKSELSDMRGQLATVHEFQSIAEYTLDGKIISVNENYLKLTGYTASDLAGQDIGILLDLKYRHSTDNVIFWGKLNIGEPISGTFKRIGKGFKTIWIQATYFPMMDLNGKPFKVVEYATDVTKYMQLEHSLARTVEQVQEVVQAVKNNDLTHRIPLEGKVGGIASLSDDVNSLVDCMASIIGMINKTGDSIIAAANLVNAASKALSLRR
jgi:methyl-accepting chemotaxis protein